eukprot:TRINITY_DN5113_c1_g1_i3.p1 TRINITY_DN5113_c1_g1~~TRINITY_DN5113_c1_g1_i3.p1  ORF type:complete len:280 (+),score=1.52 TRINITY_DN5113_c1_g1_i3:1334-2173(+)
MSKYFISIFQLQVQNAYRVCGHAGNAAQKYTKYRLFLQVLLLYSLLQKISKSHYIFHAPKQHKIDNFYQKNSYKVTIKNTNHKTLINIQANQTITNNFCQLIKQKLNYTYEKTSKVCLKVFSSNQQKRKNKRLFKSMKNVIKRMNKKFKNCTTQKTENKSIKQKFVCSSGTSSNEVNKIVVIQAVDFVLVQSPKSGFPQESMLNDSNFSFIPLSYLPNQLLTKVHCEYQFICDNYQFGRFVTKILASLVKKLLKTKNLQHGVNFGVRKSRCFGIAVRII